jgi:hypothetical protein
MKIKKYKDLSDDIQSNDLNSDTEKLKGEYQIEEILDIFTDPKDIPVTESAGAIGINTDLSVKEVKRGDYVWITALLRKPGQSFTSPAVQGILKLRVVDMFYGLQYLNKVINR